MSFRQSVTKKCNNVAFSKKSVTAVTVGITAFEGGVLRLYTYLLYLYIRKVIIYRSFRNAQKNATM